MSIGQLERSTLSVAVRAGNARDLAVMSDAFNPATMIDGRVNCSDWLRSFCTKLRDMPLKEMA